MENLYAWAAGAAAALELEPWTGERETVTAILDLAGDVAHGVTRPAAPVAAFLAGVAVGAGGATAAGLPSVLAALRATVPGEPGG